MSRLAIASAMFVLVETCFAQAAGYSYCQSQDPKTPLCIGYLQGYADGKKIGTQNSIGISSSSYNVYRPGKSPVGSRGYELPTYSTDGTIFIAPKGFDESDSTKIQDALKGLGIAPTIAIEVPK